MWRVPSVTGPAAFCVALTIPGMNHQPANSGQCVASKVSSKAVSTVHGSLKLCDAESFTCSHHHPLRPIRQTFARIDFLENLGEPSLLARKRVTRAIDQPQDPSTGLVAPVERAYKITLRQAPANLAVILSARDSSSLLLPPASDCHRFVRISMAVQRDSTATQSWAMRTLRRSMLILSPCAQRI